MPLLLLGLLLAAEPLRPLDALLPILQELPAQERLIPLLALATERRDKRLLKETKGLIYRPEHKLRWISAALEMGLQAEAEARWGELKGALQRRAAEQIAQARGFQDPLAMRWALRGEGAFLLGYMERAIEHRNLDTLSQILKKAPVQFLASILNRLLPKISSVGVHRQRCLLLEQALKSTQKLPRAEAERARLLLMSSFMQIGEHGSALLILKGLKSKSLRQQGLRAHLMALAAGAEPGPQTAALWSLVAQQDEGYQIELYRLLAQTYKNLGQKELLEALEKRSPKGSLKRVFRVKKKPQKRADPPKLPLWAALLEAKGPKYPQGEDLLLFALTQYRQGEFGKAEESLRVGLKAGLNQTRGEKPSPARRLRAWSLEISFIQQQGLPLDELLDALEVLAEEMVEWGAAEELPELAQAISEADFSDEELDQQEQDSAEGEENNSEQERLEMIAEKLEGLADLLAEKQPELAVEVIQMISKERCQAEASVRLCETLLQNDHREEAIELAQEIPDLFPKRADDVVGEGEDEFPELIGSQAKIQVLEQLIDEGAWRAVEDLLNSLQDPGNPAFLEEKMQVMGACIPLAVQHLGEEQLLAHLEEQGEHPDFFYDLLLALSKVQRFGPALELLGRTGSQRFLAAAKLLGAMEAQGLMIRPEDLKEALEEQGHPGGEP